MNELPTVDLLTPCRNRVKQLQACLPSWLACDQISRIVVVDFNSTSPVIEDLGELADQRVTVVRVEDEPLWRQGRAQNVGLGVATADFVLKIDTDVTIIELRPYLETLARDSTIYYRGFSQFGTSSGLCLAPRALLQSVGGYHDHLSGWGGDDVDLYHRLAKMGLKRQLFGPDSFREEVQPMDVKNAEAPRLDSELIDGEDHLIRNPKFTSFRNGLLSRLHRQSRHKALRWHYLPTASPAGHPTKLLHAKLRKTNGWRLKLARHNIELANILAVANFHRFATPWELMHSDPYRAVVARHGLPSFRSRSERKQLIRQLPDRLKALKGLAAELGLR